MGGKQVQVQWAPDGSQEDQTPIQVDPMGNNILSPDTGPNPYNHVRVPTLNKVKAVAGKAKAPAPITSAYNQVRPGQNEMRARAAQLTALKRLQDYSTGQETAEDRAQQAAYSAQQDQYARAMGGAQQANLQARGYGNPLLAGLGQQVRAQQQGMASNQQGLDMNAYAQQRALQSMGAAGQLATGIRSQQWDEDYKRARAGDIIRNANVNATNTVRQGNTTRTNTVGQYNAGLPWQIASVGEQQLAGQVDTLSKSTAAGLAKNQRQLDTTKDLISGGVQLGATVGKIAGA